MMFSMSVWLQSLWRRWRHLRVEAFSEYLDGRLSPHRKQRMERHLDTCQQCRQELASLEYTVQLLHRVPAASVPRSFTLRVAPVREREARTTRLPSLAFGTATASVVLLLAVLVSADLGGVLTGEAPLSEQVATSPEAAAAPTLESTETEADVQQETAAEAPTMTMAQDALQCEATGKDEERQAILSSGIDAELEVPEDDLAAPTNMASQEAIPLPSLPEGVQQEAEPEAATADGTTVEAGGLPPAPTPAEVEQPSTGIIWRVLESLLGFFVLVLLGGVFWRVRRARSQITP